MEVEEHLRRAASFEASAARLDPVEDTELYVIFLMRAGTHRINAALLAMGITAVLAEGGRVGDLYHTYKPRLEGTLPVAVDVEASNHAPALNRNLPDRRMKGLPAPCDVAGKTDVNRQKSRHRCSLSRVINHPKPTFQFLYDRVCRP